MKKIFMKMEKITRMPKKMYERILKKILVECGGGENNEA